MWKCGYLDYNLSKYQYGCKALRKKLFKIPTFMKYSGVESH